MSTVASGGEPLDWLGEHAERRRRAGLRRELQPRPAGDGLPSNTLLLAGPQGQLHRYRKLHPFSFAGEHEHYAAGTELLQVELLGLRCSFFICYDLRFANEFWSLAENTDLYVVVANWPARRREHWTSLLRARAIENQAYVAGVNRVGPG